MKTLPYKDVHAASGSQLYAALEAGDKQKAEQIYQEVMREFHKWWPEDKRHLLNWCIGKSQS